MREMRRAVTDVFLSFFLSFSFIIPLFVLLSLFFLTPLSTAFFIFPCLFPCLYLLLILHQFLCLFLPPLGPYALSAIIGQATPRTRVRTDTAIDPYNTDTDSTNSYNTRTVSDDINHNNRKTSNISRSSSNSNLSESDPRPSSLSTALALPLPLPGKALSKDSTQPLYVPSMYIPIILPVPKSSTWCPIRVNVYAEDDVILRYEYHSAALLWHVLSFSLHLPSYFAFSISFSFKFIYSFITYFLPSFLSLRMCVYV